MKKRGGRGEEEGKQEVEVEREKKSSRRNWSVPSRRTKERGVAATLENSKARCMVLTPDSAAARALVPGLGHRLRGSSAKPW